MSQQTKDLVEEPAAAAAARTGQARSRRQGVRAAGRSSAARARSVSIFSSSARQAGAITLDPGYGNTGACESAITFIDGEEGILRYRGYPIEEIAGSAQFTEICYLLIYGQLPSAARSSRRSSDRLTYHTPAPRGHEEVLRGLPVERPSDGDAVGDGGLALGLLPEAPRATTTSTSTSCGCWPRGRRSPPSPTRSRIGQPFIYPRNDLSYCRELPAHDVRRAGRAATTSRPVLDRALNLLLILHADHEQNCSTSTVRMVGSSQANLFASISAGICALWGPLHGGANQAVIEMLERSATTAATTRSTSTWPRTRARASG